MSNEIKEGLKELGRTAVLALIPLIIDQLQNGRIDYRTLLVAGAIAVLSGIDKWLHKSERGVNSNGLTGF